MLKKITILGLILFAVGAIGSLTLFGTVGFSSNLIEIDQKSDIDAKDIMKLEVTTDIVDLIFVPHESDTISVRLFGKVPKKEQDNYQIITETTEREGLSIAIKSKDHTHFGFNISFPDAEISLPNRIYDQMVIRSNTGDIEFEDLESKNLVIVSETGDITFRRFGGERAELKTVTGEIKFNEIEANITEITTFTGDVKFTGLNSDTTISTSTGDIEGYLHEMKHPLYIRTETGDADITYKESPNGVALDFQSFTGRADIDVPGMEYRVKEKHRIDGLKKSSRQSDAPVLQFHSETGDLSLSGR